MATNGATAAQGFAPVLAALATLQSVADRSQKAQAHAFLERFQKSPEAWTSTFEILRTHDAAVEAKLFAATTLKGKITYDLHQLPREFLSQLRDTLLALLSSYAGGPKPIRTQLCVCLANLAIQMTEWKDVLQMVVTTLGSDSQSISCVLEFLHVLPEEVTEGRKINLTEEELSSRTRELLEDNAEQVLGLLSQYAHSSASAATNPLLMECITSWLREVPIVSIASSPLLDFAFNGLTSEESFEAAVECICSFFRETRDVDDTMDAIQILYPRTVALTPRIALAAEEGDADTFKGIARIFAEAGEAWVLLVARLPEQFRGLVESILETAARDSERDAISLTFNFWYELKQYLTLEKYIQARLQYVDVYAKLVDIMIRHLEYPTPEGGNEKDLFEGDREQEDKFREFRHQMGDVLKDCCAVIGVTDCLKKSYDLIEKWVGMYGSQARDGQVPHWQQLEAPLFSMRAMGRMVPPDEQIMLPQLMPLLVQLPDHEKVRFQAVMALGRYTEWTAQHPETLQPQLQFIMASFDHPSKDVVRAAALSFKFFCNDCAELLKEYTPQLQQFYENVLDRLPANSQEEITDGVASVIAQLPLDQVYHSFKLFCDPVVKKLMSMAQSAADDNARVQIADRVKLITIFIKWIQPYVDSKQLNPAVKYCQEIFPVLTVIADNFLSFTPILECVCSCWRNMVLSYRSSAAPLLPGLADKLVAGFNASRQGCYLWASDSIVREFSAGAEDVDPSTADHVYRFFEQQATVFLRALNDLPPEELPDVIEDFFRMAGDALLYHSYRTIPSALMNDIISAAIFSLTLLKEEPLLATIQFLRDLLAYGSEDSPTSSLENEQQKRATNPPEIQAAVKQLLTSHGETIVQRMMTGMMYSFPRDCVPDASGVVLAMFQILPQETAGWVGATIALLPQGSISPQEAQRLANSINQNIQLGESRKIRTLLQDFTTSYRRRNVTPREGLGRLEATRFRFTG